MENSSQIYTEFLPISRADMESRGWEQLDFVVVGGDAYVCLLYTSPSPRDRTRSRMPSSA